MVGRADLIDRLSAETTAHLGAKLSAQEASLLLRGLRTLPLRMERVHQSGLTLVQKLSAHPSVKHVYHPDCNRIHSRCSAGMADFSA